MMAKASLPGIFNPFCTVIVGTIQGSKIELAPKLCIFREHLIMHGFRLYLASLAGKMPPTTSFLSGSN